MDKNNITNIWEIYGVKENPFSISPLLVRGGIIPLESFVGRAENIKRLIKILGSKGGSRTLVYGDIGVGKTSFVNLVRSNAYGQKFFTPFKEIAVQEDWSPLDFIFNTLSGIYGTLKLMVEKPLDESLFIKLNSLLELGESNLGFNLQVAGFGGGFSEEQKQPTKITMLSLQNFFEEIINDINKNTRKEVIIHYNNLELLSETKLRSVFNNLRDFFQTKGVHFIFVGNLTVHTTVQSVPRFSSNLNDTPFNIEPLSFTEVKEIIKRRFDSLKMGNEFNYIIPYTEDSLKELYEIMNGNIRDILNSISTAIIQETEEKPVILDKDKLSKTLKEVLESRYLSKIAPRARDVLFEILKCREITNKAISDKLKIPRSNVSTYISDLQSAGCVYLRRKTGKDKFWSPEPKIKWFLLKGNEKGQKTLSSF